MKKVYFYALVVVICMSTSVFGALDLFPAPWRGDSNTTYQAWTFDNGNNPADLEAGWDNLYDTPSAAFRDTGGALIPDGDNNTWWMEEHPQIGLDKHYGVWRTYGTDYLELVIPNDPVERTTKEVYIQITYSASALPLFKTTPGFADLVGEVHQLDSDYNVLTLLITIEPNPDLEIIEIRPNDCTMYIDEIVIDTRCIPEPMTICLLGLGSLALLRKHRA
jgi:hypothetical protein